MTRLPSVLPVLANRRTVGRYVANLQQLDETELVIGPPRNVLRTLVYLRFVNNDTVSHTPDFRIRTTDARRISAGHEYVRVVPQQAIAAGSYLEVEGFVCDLEEPEAFVVELAAAPTTYPSVLIRWNDEPLSALP